MKSLFYTLILLFPLLLRSQNTIGLPEIENFSKQDYQGGLQNWQISQDPIGNIYVANNEGLLCYDGEKFTIFHLPNKSIVRSLLIDNNRIYVGGQDELGYFQADNLGHLHYHDLAQLLNKEDRHFGDLWSITQVKGDIFFRSTSKIFHFKNNHFSSIIAPNGWAYLGYSNKHLYVYDYKEGLLELSNGELKPILKNIFQQKIGDQVTSILSLDSTRSLIVTLKSGLFELNDNQKSIHPIGNILPIDRRFYYACRIMPNRIALGTTNEGIIIIDDDAHIVQTISKEEGLQNNNVLSLFADKEANIWVGLNNGLGLIHFNSAIKKIIPLKQDGSGYAAALYDHSLYLGTSEGLYKTPTKNLKDLSFLKGNFEKVDAVDGQIWNLTEINHQLLVGTHEGAYFFRDNIFTKWMSKDGYWNFLPLDSNVIAPMIVGGNYSGLNFFQWNGQFFTPKHSLINFKESSRFLAKDDDGNIWISHPYLGIWRIAPTTGNIRFFDKKDGLPSTLDNYVYSLKGQIRIATQKGIYRYNKSSNKFEPDPYYQSIIGNNSVRYLKIDAFDNLWFVHDKSLYVASLTKQKVTEISELKNKLVSGFEFLYPIDSSNIIIGGEQGFYNLNYKKYQNAQITPSVQIKNIFIQSNLSDSLLYGGEFGQETVAPIISNKWNSLHFSFGSTQFGLKDNIHYSYRLIGLDNHWSSFSNQKEKSFTNLPYGKYTFEVKCQNNFGIKSSTNSFSFRILPPWYLTWWAITIYVILFILFNFFFFLWLKQKFQKQKQKHEKEQNELLYIHELERNKSDAALITLQNEKLQAAIEFKNNELASNAMHLVKKAELQGFIKEKLTQVMRINKDLQVNRELKLLLQNLGADDKMGDEWEKFTTHFDSVHKNFTSNLKQHHPSITTNELKLCSYLRMNLSTKEIAQLMNITVRGVEIGRYRLRKKLGISTETNLYDYLITIG